MRKYILLTVMALCVMFLFIACDGGGEQQSSQSPSPSASGSSGQTSASASPSPAAPMMQAKQLISKEDATKLLGETFKEGIEDSGSFPGMNSCYYAAEKAGSKSYLMIAILQKQAQPAPSQPQSSSSSSGGQSSASSSPQTSGSEQSGGGSQQSGGGQISPKKVFEALKKVFADPNVAVTGYIGDDKYITSQGISILSGDTFIYISVGLADATKIQPALKAAGEMAFSNLKRIQGK